MARETVDAALVEQFKTFLRSKDMDFDNLTSDELKAESLNFLIEKYPGAKEPPNQLVELMTSPSAAISLANMEMVNPEEKKPCPDDGKSANEGDKNIENDKCLIRFLPKDIVKCIINLSGIIIDFKDESISGYLVRYYIGGTLC